MSEDRPPDAPPQPPAPPEPSPAPNVLGYQSERDQQSDPLAQRLAAASLHYALVGGVLSVLGFAMLRWIPKALLPGEWPTFGSILILSGLPMVTLGAGLAIGALVRGSGRDTRAIFSLTLGGLLIAYAAVDFLMLP